MKKTFLAFASAALFIGSASAQNFEKLFYKDQVKESDDITVSVDNAVSTAGETKFKLKITNKTNDYILYKPTESSFNIEGKDLKPSEKMAIIKPNGSDVIIVNLKGSGYNKVKNYSFVIDGLYRVAADGKTIEAENFKLPASQNEFKAGAFTCDLSNLVKTSGKTEAKFKCSYNGDNVGIIHYNRPAVKMPDGKEYANEKKPGLLESKNKDIIIMKGGEETLTLLWEKMEGGKAMDMQKVPMEVIWHATFTEAPAVKMKSETLNFEFDEALTTAKNK
ncbi:MAG: hypothetical protein K0R26_1496 [Bacteroidota bacterium]|jgi:hypothetical protein|nr:hypothetical protein [Bacteroidota bacterium]